MLPVFGVDDLHARRAGGTGRSWGREGPGEAALLE